MSFTTIIIPSDYRDAYVGNYPGKVYYRYMNSEYNYVVDSSSYTINIAKSQTDSMIVITSSSGVFNVKLINNNFKGITQRCYGKFSGDSIYVNYIPSSAPMSFYYIGKK